MDRIFGGRILCGFDYSGGVSDMMKIDEEALKVASTKLRRLRLTDEIGIKDDPPPAKTVKSIFLAGLNGLYDDDAITYVLRFGVRYYLESVEQGTQTENDNEPCPSCNGLRIVRNDDGLGSRDCPTCTRALCKDCGTNRVMPGYEYCEECGL